MAQKPATKTALLNLGVVTSMIVWLVVVVNKRAFDPPVFTALIIAPMLTATFFGWWSELRRERQLDELELAAASFGARWGVAVLGTMILLFLFVTPVQDAIVLFAESYEDNRGRPLPAPVGVFIFGFLVAMLAQMTAKSALGAVWMWNKR
jgi:hypothetical protein